MAKVQLEFEGEGSGLREELQAQRDLLAEIRDLSKQSAQNIQADAQKTVAATDAVNKSLETSVAAVALLGKVNVSGFTRSLEGASEAAGKLSKESKSSAEELSDSFRKAAEESAKTIESIRRQRDSRLSALKEAQALEAKAKVDRDKAISDSNILIEKRERLGEAIKNTGKDVKDLKSNLQGLDGLSTQQTRQWRDELAKAEAKLLALKNLLPQYADKKKELANIEKTSNSEISKQSDLVKAISDEIVSLTAKSRELTEAYEKQALAAKEATKEQVKLSASGASGFAIPDKPASIQLDPNRSDLDRPGPGGASDDELVTIREINSELKKTEVSISEIDKNTKSLSSEIKSTSESVSSGLSKSLIDAAKASDEFSTSAGSGAETMDSVFGKLVNEAKKLAKEQGIVVDGIDEQKSSTLDLLESIGAITKEEKKLFKEAVSVIDAFEKQAQVSGVPVEGAKSLRLQIRQAREELDRLIESSDGRITPELIEAAQRAGQLDDRFKDLNDTIRAFNPDERLRPVIGVINNVASGFQAATAAAGLFGNESEDLGRSLLKIQQTVAFVQGLQGFLGGLQDNLKNIRTIILATTAAQRASTVATVADTGAKTAQAAATTAASATTVTFTGVIKGLTAALLANPFTAIAVALLAIGTAMVSVLSDTRDFKAEVDDLIKSLDELTATRFRQIEIKGNLQLIQNEIDLVKEGATERGKAQKAEADYFARRAVLIAKQFEIESNLIRLRSQLNDLIASGADEEAVTAAVDAAKSALVDFQSINDEIAILEKNRSLEQIQINADRLKQQKDFNKRRLQLEEQLASDLAAIDRDIQKRLQAQEIEQADPRRKLELQREASLGELRILEQNLKRKIALVEIEKRIGVEAFQELTDKQKEARADALISSGEIQLSVKQTEAIAALEFGVWEKFYDELSDLQRSQNEERLKIQQDGNEKELAQLEIQLTAIAQKQREAGSTEAEIAAFKRREREALIRKQAQEEIDLNERLAIAQIEARERNGESEVEFERRKQRDILREKLKAALAALQALQTNTTKEGQVLRAELQATIVQLQNDIQALENTAPDVDLFDLLGLKLTPSEKAQITQAVQDIVGLVSAVQAAQQAEVQANISATDQIIADRERRVDALQAELDREYDAARAGLANNVDLIQRRINEEKRAAEEDKRRRKELVEDQRRLAKQQLVIDGIVQGSALITAAANAIKFAAAEGGAPAIIAALGSIAAFIAFFIGIQAQAKALTSNSGSELGKGGIIEGPRHSKGGVPIPGTDVVAEGGEMVTNRKSTKKHRVALEAINQDDFSGPQMHRWLLGQMEGLGISLSPEVVEQIVEDKREYLSTVNVSNTTDTRRLERRVEELSAEVVGLRSDLSRKEERFDQGGKVVIKRPGKTITRR